MDMGPPPDGDMAMGPDGKWDHHQRVIWVLTDEMQAHHQRDMGPDQTVSSTRRHGRIKQTDLSWGDMAPPRKETWGHRSGDMAMGPDGEMGPPPEGDMAPHRKETWGHHRG